MTTVFSDVYPLPWCAVCLAHPVQYPTAYECPVCEPPKPSRPAPAPRMQLDPIATSGGEA